MPSVLLPQRFLRPLFDIAGIRAREQASFAHEGASFPMMLRAGQALYGHILRRQPNIAQLAVVVGGGNNGGDGWIVAYLAAQDGIQVRVYDVANSPRKGDAKLAEEQAMGHPRIEVRSFHELEYDSAAVIVDALLGIGFQAPLSDMYEQVIGAVNQLSAQGAWVVSVDCPSGLDLHSGQATLAVQADLVVTFIGDKIGHYLQDGPVYCHEIVTENLQAVDLSEQPQAYFLEPAALDHFPPCQRRLNSHKGTYGHVTVIGGDHGFGGAAIMASEAAAKAGAGTVSLLTQETHLMAALVRNPNVMAVSAELADIRATLRGEQSVLVVGPGLGRSAWSKSVWQQCQSLSQPTVVDADGLYWLGLSSVQLDQLVLTPHPGEAARLLEKDVKEILQDLPRAASEIANRYQAVVILKGATSVVASPDGRLMIVGKPCPGLAKGGSGDVLSGMVGACLAFYQDAYEAAVMAAAWHNKAAQACSAKIGMVAMQPYQLLDYLE
ncbi:Bifunctional NAD(P)H-hydrate repair enzyme Nnr [Marinomonas aquimarina]|uniref:Bifunctional NAD(P)H-hydrate repair enzyme n=1 Tax=Marinomonas aquimarina TaxID=295068 RepID=A0A1A8THR6_9GAMM|nr:bifunctional ADP-dependent NAD(P)H-hydrate dehydratase/NAD(P)H-hydrate epimerase [Marinomonas aquimarina]SBS33131.1 Bifunctional NAD(P)H-hydrate repair enzyme Nnr [Marinomonas aquimarina]